MPHPAIAANVLQPLDVLGLHAPELALDRVVLFDVTGDAAQLVLGQVLGPDVGADLARLQDLARAARTDPINIPERDLGPLFSGDAK